MASTEIPATNSSSCFWDSLIIEKQDLSDLKDSETVIQSINK